MDQVIDVVVLEDDLMVLELHRQYVNRIRHYRLRGYAQNGLEGIELIGRIRPHLAIVDIYMPGMDGLQLLKHIRSQDWNVDVILVTAAHDLESVNQGIRYGAADYIVKPFTFRRFKKALDNYRLHFEKLRSTVSQLTQQEIDLLRTKTIADSAASLPKGFRRTTLDVIVELLQQIDGSFTVKEVSGRLGISRVTVGRYLSYLCWKGYLREVPSYGLVGRPSYMYHLNS
jgi:response regulator of citrate/malate metabolism